MLVALHNTWNRTERILSPTVILDTLQALEAQLAGLKDSIDQLKNKEKVKKQKSTQVPRAPAPAPVAPTPRASTSTASAPKRPAPKKAGGSSKKNAAGANGNGRRALDADASLTFDEKKELSEAIQTLEESELDEVIRIIKEGVPEIGDVSPLLLPYPNLTSRR